jgi:predicted nicotinamide N-methyase
MGTIVLTPGTIIIALLLLLLMVALYVIIGDANDIQRRNNKQKSESLLPTSNSDYNMSRSSSSSIPTNGGNSNNSNHHTNNSAMVRPTAPELLARRKRWFQFGDHRVGVEEHIAGRPLGTVVWDGAIVLAHLLCQNTGTISGGSWRGKRVLELGAGTGLVGIALAMHGADVELTDLPQLQQLMIDNIKLTYNRYVAINREERPTGVCGQLSAHILQWGVHYPRHYTPTKTTTEISTLSSAPALVYDGSLETSNGRSFDVIVGADVLYVDEAIFVALLSTLRAFATDHTIIYLSGARRHQFEQHYLVWYLFLSSNIH